MFELITVPFSHYCEKARWALDISGEIYRERAYMPGMHLLATKKKGRGRSVPVLIAGDACITDSTDILRFLDDRGTKFYPDNESARIEDWLDEKFGPQVRIFAYHYLLTDKAALFALVGDSFSFANRLLFRLLFSKVGPQIRRLYRIDDDAAAKARDTIVGVFAKCDKMLADGRPFLAGKDFGAADVTLAALASPVLCYPEMPYRRGRITTLQESEAMIETLPEEYRKLIFQLRDTPTALHCRKMYQERRRRISKV